MNYKMELIKVGLFVGVIVQVAHVQAQNGNPYLVRNFKDGTRRHCIRIYNCPPGHEILPCKENYTKDLCQQCTGGTVQPLLVSSSENIDSTKCFENKNKDKCMAIDVQPSRKESTRMCNFHKFCECKTSTCYYGDPCMCSHRSKPCGVNETMDAKGECIRCPPGTEKNQKGCGPCSHITYKKRYSTRTPVKDHIIHVYKTRVSTPKSSTIEKSIFPPEDKNKVTKGNLVDTSDATNDKESPSPSIMIGIIAALAVLIVAGIVLLVYVLKHYQTKTETIKDNGHHEEGDPFIENRMNILDEEANAPNENVPIGPVDPIMNRQFRSTNDPPHLDSPNASATDQCKEAVCSTACNDPSALPNVIIKICDENEQEGGCKSDNSKKDHDEITNKVIRSQDDLSSDDFQEIRDKVPNIDRFSVDSSVSILHQAKQKDSKPTRLTVGSLASHGYNQVTEKKCSPVTQVSDEGPIPSLRESEPSSPTFTNDESISSCLEYHNYDVKGEQYQRDLTNSTHVKTISNSLGFSTDVQIGSKDQTTNNKVPDNLRIPTTIADLSMFSTDKSVPGEIPSERNCISVQSLSNDNTNERNQLSEQSMMSGDNTSEKTRRLEDMNNNKESYDNDKYKIERQIGKSDEIRLQAITLDLENTMRQDTDSTFRDSSIYVRNKSNMRQDSDRFNKMGLSMPKSNQLSDSLILNNRQC